MGDYATLKAGITANIKQNDSQLITGAVLQGQLLAMVNELGAGYQFMGVATPSTNPGTPDENVFYLAYVPGIYPNFGGAEVLAGQIKVFLWDGAWSIETIYTTDIVDAKFDGIRIMADGAPENLKFYANKSLARASVTDKNIGQNISYKLGSDTGEIVTEKFIGSNLANWQNGIYWEPDKMPRFFKVGPPQKIAAEKYIASIECNRMGQDIRLYFHADVTQTNNVPSITLSIRIYAPYGGSVQTIASKLNYNIDEYSSQELLIIPLQMFHSDNPSVRIVIRPKEIYDDAIGSFTLGDSEASVNYTLVKNLDDSYNINAGAIFPFTNVQGSLGTSEARSREIEEYLKAILDIEVYGADDNEGFVYQVYLLSKERVANDWGNGVRLNKLSATDFSLVDSVSFKSPTAPPAIKTELDKIALGYPAWMQLNAFGKVFRILVDGSHLTSGGAGEWGSSARLGASHYISPKCYRPVLESAESVTSFATLKEAVQGGKLGMMNIGQNVVVGLKNTTYNSENLQEVNENYKLSAPDPLFPMVKRSSLVRLADNLDNMLYICSFSDKHIFYTICPTAPKHIDYTSYDQYAVNYFYFAPKSNPSQLTKVILPSVLPGAQSSSVGRKKFVFEMANGDILLEVENGYAISATKRSATLCKISGIFDAVPVNNEITVSAADCSLSLELERNTSRISAFEQIAEAKPGEIYVAPYGAGITAIIYHSVDYGDTWEVIFCGDTENDSIAIAPKAEALGEGNEYGAWPTPETVISDTSLDWSGTGNGNVHIHGIAYDRWMKRLWVCTGDGAGYPNGVTGIWWSDDIGRTWHRLATRDAAVMGDVLTQLMFPIPIEHSVLFATDGTGDGFWRWSRGTKSDDVVIEPAFHYFGENTNLVVEAGRWSMCKGFAVCSFAPDNIDQGDWMRRGGIVATKNGYDFQKIYEDEFTEVGEITPGMTEEQKLAVYQHAFETAEIGWCCNVIDCGDCLILSADKGGYIRLDL